MKQVISVTLAAILLLPAWPALAADTTRPQVGIPSPDSANVGISITVTATVSDSESGLTSCNLYVDNEDVGAMVITQNTASKSYKFFYAGIHTMFVFCRDNAGNFQSGPTTSVTVTPQSGSGDLAPPSVGQLSPTIGNSGEPITLLTAVSDSGSGVAACNLIVDGFSRGDMDVAFGTASKTYTFPTPGSYEVYAQCFDAAGNGASGNAITFIALQPTAAPSPDKPNPNPRLIKLNCQVGASADHPCRAVYYHGTDDKRHAFPNAKVFYSWYQDFSSVEIVSQETMSAIPLGKQVTYRPGYTLVKFTTLNKVYAVSKGGVLRWVTSEAAAHELYGDGWNKIVHDISDTFFLDYTFGADILTPADYSPTAELTNTPTIDDNF